MFGHKREEDYYEILEFSLTLFSGSLSAHSVAGGSTQGQLMTLLSSSLPSFQAPFWNYKIKIIVFINFFKNPISFENFKRTIDKL